MRPTICIHASTREKRIKFLDTQIKEIEKETLAIAFADQTLKNKLQYLESIPGVGWLTAVIIVAETNGFASITNIKQLASYAAMDVRIVESGKWKGKSKISKKGNSHIRKALFMPTLSRIRQDENVRQSFQRLKEKKSKGMIAVVAIQRKLLALMYTLWKKEKMYCATT